MVSVTPEVFFVLILVANNICDGCVMTNADASARMRMRARLLGVGLYKGEDDDFINDFRSVRTVVTILERTFSTVLKERVKIA